MSDNPAATIPGTSISASARSARREEAGMVRAVFDSVAPRYDLMNDLMSLGVHRVWKQIFVSRAGPAAGPHAARSGRRHGRHQLRLAAARRRAGDPVRHQSVHAARSARDRAIGSGLVGDVALLVADAERLPLPDRCVDRVSIAFGLRNCTDKAAVLREARRVLKPGGRFLCLEFSPRAGRRAGAAVRRLVVPGAAAAGPLVAEGRRKLPLSRREHPHISRPGDAGGDDARGRVFAGVAVRNLSGGIAAIHAGWRLVSLIRPARAADRLRRHRRVQGAGTDPAAARAGLRRDLRADRQRAPSS